MAAEAAAASMLLHMRVQPYQTFCQSCNCQMSVLLQQEMAMVELHYIAAVGHDAVASALLLVKQLTVQPEQTTVCPTYPFAASPLLGPGLHLSAAVLLSCCSPAPAACTSAAQWG
jgi:hypothetical protein